MRRPEDISEQPRKEISTHAHIPTNKPASQQRRANKHAGKPNNYQAGKHTRTDTQTIKQAAHQQATHPRKQAENPTTRTIEQTRDKQSDRMTCEKYAKEASHSRDADCGAQAPKFLIIIRTGRGCRRVVGFSPHHCSRICLKLNLVHFF